MGGCNGEFGNQMFFAGLRGRLLPNVSPSRWDAAVSDTVYTGMLSHLVALNDPENIILVRPPPSQFLPMEESYHVEGLSQPCDWAYRMVQVRR